MKNTEMDMQRYRAWFREYAGRFCQKEPGDQKNIDLKVDHSLRVLAAACELTVHEGLGSDTARLVRISALLHDVGRFQQYDLYKTFVDRLSVDHGDLGREILEAETVLDGLKGKDRRVVLETVRLHNKKYLPGNMDEPLRGVVQAVRDADKLDIVSVVLQAVAPGAPDNPVVRMGLSPDPDGFTRSVFNQVTARKTVERTDMAFVNDFKLLLVSWSYALNYGWTSKQVLGRGYLDRLFALLPGTPEFIRLHAGLVRELQFRAAHQPPEKLVQGGQDITVHAPIAWKTAK